MKNKKKMLAAAMRPFRILQQTRLRLAFGVLRACRQPMSRIILLTKCGTTRSDGMSLFLLLLLLLLLA